MASTTNDIRNNSTGTEVDDAVDNDSWVNDYIDIDLSALPPGTVIDLE